MLFLSSSSGMGIAPIIKLSVVNETCIPLLFLPRLHGFGTNESQPTGCVHGSRILERGFPLRLHSNQGLRLVCQERFNALISLALIAAMTCDDQIGDPVAAAFRTRMHMVDFEW